MKIEEKVLRAVVVLAFGCFFITFAWAFYVSGWVAYVETFLVSLIRPAFYAILTGVAVAFLRDIVMRSRSYLIMAIVNFLAAGVKWILFFIERDSMRGELNALWVPILLSVFCIIMCLCYVYLFVQNVKVFKDYKNKKKNEKK